MSSMKRRSGPTNESFARSRKNKDGDSRPFKRPRKDETEGVENDMEKVSLGRVTQTPKITQPKEEAALFPRGGASILTPLEHKQIKIDATRDVLFEQDNEAKQKPGKSGKGDSLGSDRGLKKKRKTEKGVHSSRKLDSDDAVKIEGLSYKRLVPGSLVLGKISQINAHDVALALPNNLTGFVPITSISDRFTERVEKLIEEEEHSDNDDAVAAIVGDDDVDLDKIFSVGQYLRAYVVTTTDDTPKSGLSSSSGKRRIELSLRPQQTNTGLSITEMINDTFVMASVRSVEDHGLIMDLGLPEQDLRGFMSSREVGYGVDTSKIQEGAVFLCIITGLSSNSKIVKLSADPQKIRNIKKTHFISDAPTIDAFLPGTAVEFLLTDITPKGFVGKVMGTLDVTADVLHSGTASSEEVDKKYQAGRKFKARIICTFPNAEPRKLGISLLEHVLSFGSLKVSREGEQINPLELLPLSTIVEEVTVRKVQPHDGLVVDVGLKNVAGFVHISRVRDGKLDTLSEQSGPYKVDSVHRGRVVGYNPFDGIFLLSLEQKVLDQPFLRVEDLKIGEIVRGTVERLVINDRGVGGVLVKLADGISGLVSTSHMADVALTHPEKKFKEGMSVKARVLSLDPSKRQIRLTLKKTLVNSDAPPFKSYEDISPGMQNPGTIVNLVSDGAVVQFYGSVRGFLHVSEMSEAYIKDPSEHFRAGQVVNVRVLRVDAESGKMAVSCKDPSAIGAEQQSAFGRLHVGDLVSATVTEKSADTLSVEIGEMKVRATLPFGHLTDGSETKNASHAKRTRIGQVLNDLLVLEKVEPRGIVTLSCKPTLIKAAKNKTLIKSFDDIKDGRICQGFVAGITDTAVFIQFAGGLTGLLPKRFLPREHQSMPKFGLKQMQSMNANIASVDHHRKQFVLSMANADNSSSAFKAISAGDGSISEPVDETITSLDDLTIGRLTKAKITSIRETQLNVQLANNIQGRVDISEIFDDWEDIKDRKRPLQGFSAHQVINVRVLGIHDARNHRYLPISHRTGKSPVFELSAKPSDQVVTEKQSISLDNISVGSSWIVYVNNVDTDCLWVNLTPNVRGRIKAMDASDDVSVLQSLEKRFPVGSALKARVTSLDVANNRLDLSARFLQGPAISNIQDLVTGAILPGTITKVTERMIMVQLADSISAPVNLPDLADDYEEANTMAYTKNEIVRVCVVDVDAPNKKVRLSIRPSRVLNSSLLVKDPEITSLSQLKVNDIIRGFIINVADTGIFVLLGGKMRAFVRVSDLSDSYIKDWKSSFELDQLVKGKIILIDDATKQVRLSLKSSLLEKDYVPPITFNDIKAGQVVTGKVRKVEDFGVFIVVDNSTNVSGLCHRSEMADKRVEDVRKIYEEGDVVKAKVLKVDPEKRRINFGLRASYLDALDSEDSQSDEDVDGDGMEGVLLDDDVEADEESDNGGVQVERAESDSSDDEIQPHDKEMADVPAEATSLDAGGFDWTADTVDDTDRLPSSTAENEAPAKSKKKRRSEIQLDMTGDLDANGPQSSSDFERLLLGQPDSSQLWIEYMALQIKLGELIQAKSIAERAIQTINIREETEKMNIWIALLNLENEYGTDESVEEVFKRACQFNDAQEIHERLTSIYIQSGKHSKADDLFQSLVKKFSHSPTVWYNYAHFLLQTQSEPERARTLLPRALQSLPKHTHLDVTTKFAALEFRSASGSAERGRTIFEGLLSTFPKRLDLWIQLLDLEIQQQQQQQQGDGDGDVVRALFERGTRTKGLKPKGAKAWFRRWSEWEEQNGDKKSQEKVKAKAEEWVRNAMDRKAQLAADGDDEAE